MYDQRIAGCRHTLWSDEHLCEEEFHHVAEASFDLAYYTAPHNGRGEPSVLVSKEIELGECK